VFLADALYCCNYFLIARLQARGVDVLSEQNGARITDFRRRERLGARDHLARWERPKARPQWMARAEYNAAPKELIVREVSADGRVLVTTMLDLRRACKRELGKLYVRRWNMELDLRNIKHTLGLEALSCKTPEMCEKELWVYLLAYNLIRLLMAQAALQAGVHPRQLSFKHTVQLWTEWLCRGPFPGDRAAEGRQSPGLNRTAGAQAPPQTVPVAEGAASKSPAAGALVWLSSKPFSVSKCHWG
jgi:hypothetical protein